MKWQPFAWFCIAFLTFVVIAGPAFVATVQENSQQAYLMEKQRTTTANLESKLTAVRDRFDARVEQCVESACAPLKTQLVDARARAQELEAEVTKLNQRRVYERKMKANLDTVSSRIAELERRAQATSDEEEEVELRQQVAALQTRHHQAAEKLDTLHAAASPEWDDLKHTVNDAWNQLSSLVSQDKPVNVMASVSSATN